MEMNCPKCDEKMDYQEDEPEIHIVGGWFCPECDVFVPYWEGDDYKEDFEE
jgi:hypothetical protein